jgi:recombination associated protein RdgC
MWFKNLTLFRFSAPFILTAEALGEKLEEGGFHPCTSQQMAAHGWTPPLGRKATDLVHAVNGCFLLCLQTEEKVLPAAVIREMVTKRVDEIEELEQRPVRRREQLTLRDEVLQDLLPRAFTRSRQTYAYIDPRGGWLIIDSAGGKAVEELTHRLRLALGSLPITPPRVVSAPGVVMTGWLTQGGLPVDFTLGDECELRDGGGEAGIVRCKGQDLSGEEILTHLQAGKQVTRLALIWNDRLSLLLTEEPSVRRLRFTDLVQEQLADTEMETAEQIIDAEFAVMTGELGVFLPRLLELFDGEAPDA